MKLMFVDDVEPHEIVATTFTKKAAAELRSEILAMSDDLRKSLLANPSHAGIRLRLRQLDFNRVLTGTLDAIAEDVLQRHRQAQTQPPVVIEEFIADTLMLTEGIFGHGLHANADAKDYIQRLKGANMGPTISEMAETSRELLSRFISDQADFSAFRASTAHPGIASVAKAIDSYSAMLQKELLYDFARLEQEFYERLKNGQLIGFQKSIRILVVDEYQDTNRLQEQIYFSVIEDAISRDGGMTVVGDDDQSLYRFRGATVPIFVNFPQAFSQRFQKAVRTIPLSQNYRSTDNIVDFVNFFARVDSAYQSARVPSKQPLVRARVTSTGQPPQNYPLLGMFRDDVETLANDLAAFIDVLVRRGTITLQTVGGSVSIQLDPKGGPGDVALLCSTPAEITDGGRERLPLFLRRELLGKTPAIQVFNPRGQHLKNVPAVQILCGLLLECIDPGRAVETPLHLPNDVRNSFTQWRQAGWNFVNTNPPSPITWTTPAPTLLQFIQSWQSRQPLGKAKWDKSAQLASLVYKLASWMPSFQNDIEGLVYMEAVLRTITEAGQISNYGSEIVFDPPGKTSPSIKEALWRIFVPLAAGSIDINEELLETLPNDRINIMSVHQAKGLQFPLTIVDVGSDFKKRLPVQAFRRFPEKPGSTSIIEDEVRQYTPGGVPSRNGLDRAFDDLYRQFFVAFSRPQDVLMLVGLNPTRTGKIPNVGVCWDRNNIWQWRNLPGVVQI